MTALDRTGRTQRPKVRLPAEVAHVRTLGGCRLLGDPKTAHFSAYVWGDGFGIGDFRLHFCELKSATLAKPWGLNLARRSLLAQSNGLEVVTRDIRRGEDIAPAIEAFKGRAEALYVVTDPLFTTDRVRFNTLALSAGLPTMHGTRKHVDAGGLISYGSDQTDLFRRAGDYVDKILRGMKAADIPVEQPTKFDLVINLITAKALGLEVPPTLLARADEVI
jgi:ABC transporter substrate binding protein